MVAWFLRPPSSSLNGMKIKLNQNFHSSNPDQHHLHPFRLTWSWELPSFLPTVGPRRFEWMQQLNIQPLAYPSPAIALTRYHSLYFPRNCKHLFDELAILKLEEIWMQLNIQPFAYPSHAIAVTRYHSLYFPRNCKHLVDELATKKCECSWIFSQSLQ